MNKKPLPEHYWCATKCSRCGAEYAHHVLGCGCCDGLQKQKIVYGVYFEDGVFRSLRELKIAGYDLGGDEQKEVTI